jgi:probable addiction module antidote protein
MSGRACPACHDGIGAQAVPVPVPSVADSLARLLAAGDAGALLAALGVVARQRGMARVARDAGLTREALYRALRADALPRFDTIVRVCAALGVKLTFELDREAGHGPAPAQAGLNGPACDDAAPGEPR